MNDTQEQEPMPSPFRVAAFVGLALLVVILGYFAARSTSNGKADTAPTTGETTEDLGTVVPGPGSVTPSGTAPTTPGLSSADGPGYPVTETQLAAAAKRATAFLTLYLSYDYQADADETATEVKHFLAKNAMVDLNALTLNGAALAQARADELVTTVRVTDVVTTLVALNITSFNITAEKTFTTKTSGETTGEVTYAVALNEDGGWSVVEAYPVDSDDRFSDNG